MHWIPFEEPELAAALGTDAAGIRRHLTDDSHRLATLARKRGWQLKPLARHLTRRFDDRVSRQRLAALRWRTERMLTQGHLAQHVLFHTFHAPGVSARAQTLFGITPQAFGAARQAGLSPDEIARRQGRDPATARAGVLARLRAEADRGVHTRSQSRAQARRMLSRQRNSLGCWMASPLPKFTHPGTEHHHAPAIPGCGGDAARSALTAARVVSRPPPGG